MYVTLNITQQTYDAVCKQMAADRVGDYYDTPAGARSLEIPEGAPGPVLAIADRREVSWLYDDTIRCGYTVSSHGTFYCTSGLNVHGVYKNDTGQCIAFYWGRRSRVQDLYHTLRDAGIEDPFALTVVEYLTDGPDDMLWHENRAAYVLRKGDNTIVDAMSSNEWDLDASWCQDVWRRLGELRRNDLGRAAEKRRMVNKKISEASPRRCAAVN